MNPTFHDGDVVLVDLYGIPKDQDVIILNAKTNKNYEGKRFHTFQISLKSNRIF